MRNGDRVSRARSLCGADVSDVEEPRSSPLARSYDELGEGMRRLRVSRGWSRQHIVARLDLIRRREGASWTLSAGSVQRFENGHGQRPRLAHASALDEAYEANHWISLSLTQLQGPAWQPWAEVDWPKHAHHVAWPTVLAGRVWVHAWPSTRSVGLEHHFSLVWLGTERRSHRVVLGPGGQYWVFTKPSLAGVPHADLAVIEEQRPFHLLHGLGFPPRNDLEVVEIGSGWLTGEATSWAF